MSESESPPPAGPTVAPEKDPVPPSGGSGKNGGEEDWATRYKYLLADFENFRRRTERERENTTRAARARLIQELLPIYEAFHFARDAVARLPPDDPVRKGLDLLDREWQTFLKHEGVEPLAVPGDRFVADLHEAVGEAAATHDRPAGAIVEVVQQGYRFFGGILRPAKVVVARVAPPAGETAALPAPDDDGGVEG